MKRILSVKDFKTRSTVKEIDVTGKSDRNVETILRGLLRNMNTEKYFVDDIEEAGE